MSARTTAIITIPLLSLRLPKAWLSSSNPAHSSEWRINSPNSKFNTHSEPSYCTWRFSTANVWTSWTSGLMKGERNSNPIWDPLRDWTFQNQIHCKGSKIEIILFSFYLTMLALFWDPNRSSCSLLGFLFFYATEKGTRLSQNKASLQSKAWFTLRLTQADTAAPNPPLCPHRSWAEEEQNDTEKHKNNSPAHQSPQGMLWGMLHIFLQFSELGKSWAVKALCKIPALAEMGTFLRCPRGAEGTSQTRETSWHCPAETVRPCSLCCLWNTDFKKWPFPSYN